MERAVRTDVAEAARGNRDESAQQMLRFQQALSSQLTGIATLQNNQIDTFAQQLAKLTESNTQQLEHVRQHLMLQGQQARDEQAGALRRFGDGLQQQLAQMSEANERRLAEVAMDREHLTGDDRGTITAKHLPRGPEPVLGIEGGVDDQPHATFGASSRAHHRGTRREPLNRAQARELGVQDAEHAQGVVARGLVEGQQLVLEGPLLRAGRSSGRESFLT